MDRIIDLLKAFQEFEQSAQSQDFGHFGQWLYRKHQKTVFTEGSAQVFSQQLNSRFGMFLGGVVGYADAWEKLTFRNLPINGFMDFGILNQVQAEPGITKKHIEARSPSEQSTVFEALKRIQRKGLIEDKTDEHDRRVKRVFLTEEGAKTIEKVEQQAAKLSNLLVGDMSDEEIGQMTAFLERLYQFHHELHISLTKEAIAERYGL